MHNDPPKSSKVVDFSTIEIAYRISYWSRLVINSNESNLGPFFMGLSCRVSETSELLYAERHFSVTHPYRARQ